MKISQMCWKQPWAVISNSGLMEVMYFCSTDLFLDKAMKGTAVKRLKAGKGKLTVKWKKQKKGITGYQLQYGTDPSFGTGSTIIKITSPKTVKKVLKGMERKTKYYVRIRTCREENGRLSYSEWSKTKSAKVK